MIYLFIVTLKSVLQITHKDAPIPWQMGFQEAATPIMEGIISLHNDIMGIIVFITIFVTWMLARTLYLFDESKNATPLYIVHGTTIELLWTILPSFILMFIAVPSFALLYSMDEVIDPAITIKAIGHQWYWSYEYSDYNTEDGKTIEFDSYMIQEDDLELGQLRLLEVDDCVVIPYCTSSSDELRYKPFDARDYQPNLELDSWYKPPEVPPVVEDLTFMENVDQKVEGVIFFGFQVALCCLVIKGVLHCLCF